MAKTQVEQTAVIDELTHNNELRQQLLLELEQSLREQGVQVQVDLQRGILRLPESILFPTGSADLDPDGEHAIRVLAREMNRIVSCYSSDPPRQSYRCRPDQAGKLDAIFIEGHTDNVPIGYGSRFPDNWSLSAARAITTFQALVRFQPGLDELNNSDGLPLFGVSGYADRRPVASNEEDSGRRLNRRIDLRFIMTSPKAPGSTQ